MIARLAFWFLAGATIVIYLFMVLVTVPYIQGQAGGLAVFDARITGYAFEDAKAFLAALSAEGSAYYLGPQGWMDTVFPALFAATAYAALVVLLRPMLGGNGRFLAALAIVPAVLDWLENAAVAAMLRAGEAGLTPEMVVAASRWSVLKWFAYMVVIGALLVLAAIAAGRIARSGDA